MNVDWPESGKYVVAVSGGVDSVVLSHLLVAKKCYELVVAHADHGWRAEAAQDRRLVEQLAGEYGLAFEFTKLPSTTSEAEARTARYAFLEQVREKHRAQAIIVAHHADDRVETVILNLLRGTGRRGLSSLRSTNHIVRPLLNATKPDIIAYAKQHKLDWWEDETNSDTRYRRNYVRQELLPQLRKDDPDIDRHIIELSTEAQGLNEELDHELGKWMKAQAQPIPSGLELPIEELCQHSLAAVQEIIVYAANVLVPHIELDARAVAELALHVKTGRIHGTRQLHRQLCAGRRYDTLTITVCHL